MTVDNFDLLFAVCVSCMYGEMVATVVGFVGDVWRGKNSEWGMLRWLFKCVTFCFSLVVLVLTCVVLVTVIGAFGNELGKFQQDLQREITRWRLQ